MAVYKIFPTIDTTIYSMYPSMNTGTDEILETSLDVNVSPTLTPQTSRFLIQFSLDEILDVINNKIANPIWKSNLKCFTANVTALNIDTTIEVYPISQSWNMGTGRYGNVPETQNGASWVWRSYSGSNLWTTGTFNAGTTASYSSSVAVGGGTWWYTQSLSGSQTFSYYDNKDIDIDVTKITTAWYSGSIPNNGFIVKQEDEFIDNINIQPHLKYFSIDTHTIYPPCLEFKWNNSVINSGSLSFITTQPFEVSINNNPGVFYSGSINKFRVFARPTYPTKVFQTSSLYTQNSYLPTSSYYAIKDLDTNEYVVDFDSSYTKLSIDSTSSYFSLNMNGFEPERYYKILIQTIVEGSTITLDNDYYFKIING